MAKKMHLSLSVVAFVISAAVAIQEDVRRPLVSVEKELGDNQRRLMRRLGRLTELLRPLKQNSSIKVEMTQVLKMADKGKRNKPGELFIKSILACFLLLLLGMGYAVIPLLYVAASTNKKNTKISV